MGTEHALQARLRLIPKHSPEAIRSVEGRRMKMRPGPRRSLFGHLCSSRARGRSDRKNPPMGWLADDLATSVWSTKGRLEQAIPH